MKFTVQQIANMIGGTVRGNPEAVIFRLAKIDEEAEEGSICFLANPKYENYIYTTTATAVIINQDFQPKKDIASTLILVEDAYIAFTRLLEEYEKIIHAETLKRKVGMEQPCFIGSNFENGEGFYAGAFSYIGNNCKFGENVKIFPQAYIGDNVLIGSNSVVYAGAKIYSNTEIGKHCTIHAGAVIGSEGFGFARQGDGKYKAIPQLGKVILEDEVSVGANTTIDRATIGATVICKGVKLDNLIQVAHNVEIGENTVIAAQTGISGSTKVGKNCAIAGQVGMAGHLEIADHTQVGAQAGLNSHIKNPGSIVQGSPAFNHLDFLKSSVIFRRLPQLQRRLEELEEKILNLKLD